VTSLPSLNSIDDAAMRDVSNERADFITAGITLAATLLLVGTATMWLRTLTAPETLLVEAQMAIISTLLLNIALILLGWRRFKTLSAEVQRSTESAAEAMTLARFDPLTGLLNRRALDDELPNFLKEWHAKGLATAAIIVDIDTFKSINDLFGHAGGDKVISSVAIRITASLPESAVLARLGGDEFAAFFPVDIGDTHSLQEIGEHLITELSEPVQIEGTSASTSSSVGGAVSHDPDVTADELLRHADAAMYRAKRLGRRRFCQFDSAMQVELDKRDLIERELRIAIQQGQMFPVYEPLVDLTSGIAIGYEMLARWTSPVLGTVGPADFIPVAEEAGLISVLSERLFRRAFLDAKTWSPELILSVNVSPLQLRDPWFAQKLLKLMAETGFPGHRLIVEITESAIVDNLPLAQTVFTSLHNQGISMALDDFGTGYSSIASLRALPFDSVKIDREFIRKMAETAGPDSIAEAVLQLGRSLGLPVVAEGIECGEIAQRLSDLDCAIGQGYFYGTALSSAEVVERHSEPAARSDRTRKQG
jgi:diguanylate cyclase (GGDEF)-like protein